MKTKYIEIDGMKIQIENSNRKGKQLKATFSDGEVIHFGDNKMKEYPNTKRGDNYCSRSLGIKSRKKSANTLSRKVLWNCKKNKSMSNMKDAGVNVITKEEYFDNI